MTLVDVTPDPREDQPAPAVLDAPGAAEPLASAPAQPPASPVAQPPAASTPVEPSAEPPAEPDADDGRFRVRLSNFEGPFDLLLQLISQHQLDVTEVALHQVTDDFIAHIHSMGEEWDLDETTEFLVIAATLLDLKAARLLPSAEVEDAEDLALLEARDLLFARLLQYRAYKQVATLFAELEATALRRYPRVVALEDRYTKLLPEVRIGVSPAEVRRDSGGGVPPEAAGDGVVGPPARSQGVGTRTHGHPPASGWPSPEQRRSRSWCPTAATRWRSWQGSWPCWSCTGNRRSRSTRRTPWVS